LPGSPTLPYPLALQLERLFAGQSNTEELICASRFRPWGKGGKEVRPFVDPQTNGDVQCAQKKTYAQKKSSKNEYATSLLISAVYLEKILGCIKKYTDIQEELLSSIQNKTVYSVGCELTRGYRHQVRVHLAWCGLPIIGDELYGGAKMSSLLFFADKIKFTHPAANKPVEFCTG
jgi:23S rRNA pseudouridine1911/1915/1917 synthase